MEINQSNYSMILNDSNGTIESFSNGVKQFICKDIAKNPLFTIRFLDENGLSIDLSAFDSNMFIMNPQHEAASVHIKLHYQSLASLPIDVHVEVECPHDGALTYWQLSIDNQTDYIIEWIHFPNVIVPNDLIATGGTARLVWPAMEGVLVEDMDLREESWLKYQPTGYPSKGWEGVYPGPCPTQFMAYYNHEGGLYFGSHDEHSHLKAIEFYKFESGICLEIKLFPGGVGRGSYQMDYSVALGVFEGDWHKAADIYRQWYLGSAIEKPKKIHENDALPEWMKESPVIVTYPVRGEKDTGNMAPNQYYPFTNATPYLSKLSASFNSKVMALLMHWEGTAPWAPPYVWPPFGGEENFKQFANELHEQGNLLGVYCSGIGWTNESVLLPEYTRQSQFEDENLLDIMCAAPNGDVPNSLICNGPIRWGHDMCPANDFVSQVVVEEVGHIISSGCDYIQFFDQNLGGLSYFCYSKKHGHPAAPGKWQKDAMIELYKKLADLVAESGKKVVIGCEAAAAEPFIPYMAYNDMRFNITLFVGNPIPLYQYIYHEYINNFMGNQNTAAVAIDIEQSPNNLLWRTAYSFIAGDMLTVVMKDQGKINWDWGTEWDVPEPDQDEIITFIKNINGWRKGAALSYLCHGRMLKPFEVTDIELSDIIFRNGKKITNPVILSSRWVDPKGREAQIFVNYSKDTKQFGVHLEGCSERILSLIHSADGLSESILIVDSNDQIQIQMKPLSAIMLKL